MAGYGWAQWAKEKDFNEELAEQREHENRSTFADRLCINTDMCRDPFDIIAEREEQFGQPIINHHDKE